MIDQAEPAWHPRPWATVAALFLVGAVFILPARADFLKPVIPMEEGSVLVYPERILEGDVPNRDFETMYGPGNLWVLAGVYRLFGVSVTSERVVGLLYRLLLVVALFLIGRRSGLGTGVACGLIAIVMTAGSWAVAYAWFGGLAFAVLSLWVVTTRRWLLFGGVIGGLALVFRPDLVVAVGALILMCRSRRFIAGVALGLLLYVPHILLAGLSTVIDGLIIDPLIRINPGRRFPIPWGSPLLWLILGATGLLVAAGWVRRQREGDRGLLTCAFFSIGLLPYALQRADAFHLASAGCVAVALVPASTQVLVSDDRRDLAVWLSCLTVVVLGWGSTVRGTMESIGQTFGVGPPVSYPVAFAGRSVRVPLQDQVTQLSGLLAAVASTTQPGDRIFVGPDDLTHPVYNDTFLYYFEPDLVPASYFLEMNPGTADRPGSRLEQDVSSADVLILTTRYDDWTDRGLPQDETVSAIPGGLCSGAAFGPWEMLVRCADSSTEDRG